MSVCIPPIFSSFDPVAALDIVDVELQRIDLRCKELLAEYRAEAFNQSLPGSLISEERTRI